MKGTLSFFSAPDEVTSIELPKESITCGSGPDDWLHLQPSEADAGALTLEWTPSAATWTIRASDSATLNGKVIAGAVLLQHGDTLRVADRAFRASLLPATPVYSGQPTHIVPLTVQSLTFGRDSGEGSPDLVRLDSESSVLSRRHLRIDRDGDGHRVTDESRTGSLLNGRPFETASLVLGDRFKLGPYHFEYTGRAVRMISPIIGARIEARDLGVTLGGKQILRDIDLTIDPCSFDGLLGGSGHGKSTLLNALCGLVPLSSGAVAINGRTVTEESARNLGLGFVPQEDIVHPELTVGQALEFSARLRLDRTAPAAAMRTLARSIASRLGLEERWNQRISSLSGGQRKRVSIATELLTKPAALFLDEPSSGLDPATEYALMSELRRLAESDCTVIASTHVLGRAYLFDQLCFLRKGETAYQGAPAGATQHFGVDSLDEVYLALEKGSPTSTTRSEASLQEKQQREIDAPDIEPVAPAAPLRPGLWRTLTTLLVRQLRIVAADPLNLLFLLAQPIAIGFLIGWVADSAVLRGFLAVISTLWFGTSNGAQQIVREIAVFRRERLCGLNIHSYLASKFGFLTALTGLQALILLVVLGLITPLFHPHKVNAHDFDMKFMAMNGLGPDQTPLALPLWRTTAYLFDVGIDVDDDAPFSPQHAILTSLALKLLALGAAAAVGVSIGLAISAVAQSTTQSVMWVPLVLIPQILLGGFVVTFPEMSRSVRSISHAIPSFAAQRLMDVANIYGQPRPLLSNTTRRPQFLSGRKEKVEWNGQSEQFDEPARHNVSWQNLVTDVERIGQHKKIPKSNLRGMGVDLPPERVKEVMSYNQLYRDSVDDRSDVLMPRSKIYSSFEQAILPLLVIAGWITVCYTAAATVLYRRR